MFKLIDDDQEIDFEFETHYSVANFIIILRKREKVQRSRVMAPKSVNLESYL